tara:strand:+ start:144 stop:1235 length:1092 start_codon:yes stop_codon:yes gene_type:complete
MPLYMDRHNIPKEITADHVFEMHQQDLKVEHKFGCRGITYWCDETRKNAFCLIEAPNEKALKDMHAFSHGDVPNEIVEVDENIVKTFLGRINDPPNDENTEPNIIRDSAFRAIMSITFKKDSLMSNFKDLKVFVDELESSINEFEGTIVKHSFQNFLISFTSVTKAVCCAQKIQSDFQNFLKTNNQRFKLKIGLGAGLPVTEENGFFKETIQLTQWLCDAIKGEIVLSSQVKFNYETENLNEFPSDINIKVLHMDDENFLKKLMKFIETIWNDTKIKVEDFSKHLGYSKTQFYRKITSLTGKSPNTFLKDYRLNRALQLMDKQSGNISQIAFETGFNTPSYFSKCFHETFGISPSHYTKSDTK